MTDALDCCRPVWTDCLWRVGEERGLTVEFIAISSMTKAA